MHSRKYLAVALTAALTFTAGSALAQTSLGILAGVARDTTGAVVANATVTIVNTQNGQTRTVKTSSDGSYRIDAISTGKYNLSVTEVGFDKADVKDITVAASSVTSYDVVLTVGQANTELTVEADNATINTENGTLTGVVGALEIDKLPIFSLNPIELATTLPGVQTVSGSGFSNGINIQVNGARPRSNNFLLDGQEINDVGIGGQAFQPQIPDIFDSLNVITNSASAEYGRAGGGIVNLITKQGTNTFHGTVFERYAGSGLNSVPGGYRGSPFTKTRQNEHSYGFTAGGPIFKNKLFAFGALELQRIYGSETPGVNLLPDAAGYATLQTITGPAAAQVALLDKYLNNGAYLTQDLEFPNTSGTNFTSVGPVAGCPGTCNITLAGFQRPTVAISNPDTQWMYRVDYRPWDKDTFTVRYLHDRTSLSPDFFNNGNALAGFDTEQGGPSELGEGSWTHVFTPNLLNEFRASEARIGFTFSPTAATIANPLNSLPTLTFASVSVATAAGSLGLTTLGPNQNFPQGRKEDLYQFQDTIGLTKGRQSFRMGVDIGRLLEIDLVSQNALGTIDYGKGGSGGTSLGNFLQNQTGPSGDVTKVFGKTRVDSHGYRNGFFLQDDVKLTSDLTLNLGVRYDFLTDPENNLPYPALDPNNPFAPINTVIKVKGDYNNISPRLGFAYSPHGYFGFLGDGKTVLRGGFGIFYDSTFSNILVNSTQSSPNAVSYLAQMPATTGNGVVDPSAVLAAATPVLNPFSSVLSEVNNTVNPLTYQYNIGIERELPGATTLSVRYIGNRGEKEFANQQFNYFVDGGTQRLNPNRGAINSRGNFADSSYNSAEVDVTHNFSHGLELRANYVFGKDLDDGSEVFTTLSSPTSYSANLTRRGQDWGPSAYDHREYFSIAYVYSPAGLHAENKFTNAALGVLTRHWTFAGVSQLQSGNYTSITSSGIDSNGDGSSANDRPIVGNPTLPYSAVGFDGIYLGATPGLYYDSITGNQVARNQEHFIVPYGPNGEFQTQEIGRGSYHSPGFTTHLMSLEKGIGLSYLHLERGTLLLRAEASNVFNHNDNTVGDTDVLDSGAGYLDKSRTGSNRTLILWAKVQF